MIGAVVLNFSYCNSTETDDGVLREWRNYQKEEIPEEFYIEDKDQRADGISFIKYKRVDDYWHKIMQLTDHRGELSIQYSLLSLKYRLVSLMDKPTSEEDSV